jgi:hypothetical protein
MEVSRKIARVFTVIAAIPAIFCVLTEFVNFTADEAAAMAPSTAHPSHKQQIFSNIKGECEAILKILFWRP